MNALIPVSDGSESLETITIANVLRRADIRTTLASITGSRQVRGTRDIDFSADELYADVADQAFDLIALPGGEAGAHALAACAPLIEKLKAQRLAHHWYGGICAAPALVLAPHGLLDGKQATCYPSFRDALLHFVDRPVVVDGHCITSQGPATAIAFALQLVEALCGATTRRQVADGLLHHG